MVNDLDIIHMNGRIYDPTLGRFLQADPFIQFPNNSQSYNRYSYVLNNPMSYTDPSGYFLSGLSKKIGRKLIRSASKIFGAKLVNMVGTAISTYFGSAFGAAAWTYEFNRAMGNSSTGSLRAAGIAFIAASLPTSDTGSSFGNFVVDGAVGGSLSYASGGNFGHGFWAAGLNSAVGGGNVSSNPYVNVISSAVIGGTISKVTGGKFANGASSAAFSAALRQDWSSSSSSMSSVSTSTSNGGSTCLNGPCQLTTGDFSHLNYEQLVEYRKMFYGLRIEGYDPTVVKGAIAQINGLISKLIGVRAIDYDSIWMGKMVNNFHASQKATNTGLIWGAAAIYSPVATASYIGVSRITGTEMTTEGLLMSVGIGQTMVPVVNYLGSGSRVSKTIWEHNSWWLGNGVGFIP
jgi:RHS repeat-associated protein